MNNKTIFEKIKLFDKRVIIVVSTAAVFGLAGIVTISFGKSSHDATMPKAEAPVSVTAITVEPGQIDSVLSVAGSVSSRNISLISSKVMGRVAALAVNEGDRVSRGELLIRIESGEIAAQVYQAEAAYNNAKLQYDRIKRLFDETAATQMEMDQATLGFESAKAGLNAAKSMESYTIVTAPIGGRIVEKHINVGEMAVPGQPMLKIEDNANLRLDVTLKEQDLRFVRLGQSVTVRIDALPGKDIKARVAQVVPAADLRTHSFIVKIDIPADKTLITGMYGKAFFTVGRREAILIPKTSIVETAGLTGVYMVSGEGNAIFQMVQLGEDHGDAIEATAGLKAGDRVIIVRPDGRIDGRKVVVAEK